MGTTTARAALAVAVVALGTAVAQWLIPELGPEALGSRGEIPTAGAQGPAPGTGAADAPLEARLVAFERRIAALEAAALGGRPVPAGPTPATASDGARGVAPGAAPPEAGERPPVRRLTAAELGALAAGGGRAGLVARFGEPDRTAEAGEGMTDLHFFREGLWARIDSAGRVDRVRMLGQAESTVQTMWPRRWEGIFKQGSEWYRPKIWEVDGVSIGHPAQELYRLWGDPDRTDYWQDGREFAIYLSRKLKVELDRDYRVIHIEFDASLE